MSHAGDDKDFYSKYELGKEIGRGGFSMVYQCKERLTNNIYAVKIIDLRPLRLRERFNPARLRREVDIMRRLNHPNIIKFIEVYETIDNLLMVMEYCPGAELFDVILQRKYFNEIDAKPIFAQVAKAIFYLHCMNILHRDVKPENILILDEADMATGLPIAKLLDFGLSKNANAGSAAKTFVGTPCYLAPEVEYTSKGLGGTYGLPADCWSLGAVLYVMLVARFPEFEQDNTGKVVVKLTPALWDGISTPAKELIRGLMNTNQSARLTAAAALQHPWLSEYRMTTQELSMISLQCYDMSQHLQEEEAIAQAEYAKFNHNNVEMTSGGIKIKDQAMVVRNTAVYNNSPVQIEGSPDPHFVGNSNPVQLAPLLHLQRTIANCLEEAHNSYIHMPEVANQVRRGAVLCRHQVQESTKMLHKVEQTASAVLGLFPDLELAIEENEPQLAADFFNVVKGWVIELRELVHNTQKANQASLLQIQAILEESSHSLNSQQKQSLNTMLKQRLLTILNKRTTPQIIDGILTPPGSPPSNDEENDNSNSPGVIPKSEMNISNINIDNLSTDQVLKLFLHVFDTGTNSFPLSLNANEQRDRATSELERIISDESSRTVESVDAIDKPKVLTSSIYDIDEGPHESSPTNRLKSTDNDMVIDNENSNNNKITYKNSHDYENSIIINNNTNPSDKPVVVHAAKNHLSDALMKLRQVDLILDQLNYFWANTELVLDVLTKKGQHVEQFIGFSQKPKLLARFQERMEEYKRFWEGVSLMSNNYINGVQQQGMVSMNMLPITPIAININRK
eukprot:gene18778-24545_t